MKAALGAALGLPSALLTACALRTETEAGMDPAAPPVTAGAESAGGALFRTGPGAIDLARYYPAGAREQNISGRAELSCRVSGGRLSPCVVVSEDPPGLGFGLAAIRASANLVAAPRDSSGAGQEGRTVTVPFAWSATP